MVKLSDLASEIKTHNRGVEFAIFHPGTGEPTDIIIRIAGPDSDVMRNAKHRIVDQRAKRGSHKMSAAELEEQAIDLLASAVLDWRGLEDGGVALPATDQNVRRVLADYPWIRAQVDAHASSYAGFMNGAVDRNQSGAAEAQDSV